LLARLAAVRTWIYVSHQRGWIEDARSWQERTRAIEDRLGDVLHQRLVERFVQARGGASVADAHPAAPNGHHPFAKLAQLGSAPAPERDQVEAIVQADYAAFELSSSGELRFGGQRVARLVRGKTLLSPGLKPLLDDSFDLGARTRIERRLRAQVKDWLAELLAPLQPPQPSAAGDHAALRGVLYQLEQGLGCVARRELNAVIAALTPEDHGWLRERGILLGRKTVFARDMLTRARLNIRAALCHAFDQAIGSDMDFNALVWTLVEARAAAHCLPLGYFALERVAVRCDALEALITELERKPEAAQLAQACALLRCSEAEGKEVLRRLRSRRRRRRRRDQRSRAATH
jgi:ATP-dependent RNA helicase SUPV3L1/SUV3